MFNNCEKNDNFNKVLVDSLKQFLAKDRNVYSESNSHHRTNATKWVGNEKFNRSQNLKDLKNF